MPQAKPQYAAEDWAQQVRQYLRQNGPTNQSKMAGRVQLHGALRGRSYKQCLLEAGFCIDGFGVVSEMGRDGREKRLREERQEYEAQAYAARPARRQRTQEPAVVAPRSNTTRGWDFVSAAKRDTGPAGALLQEVVACMYVPYACVQDLQLFSPHTCSLTEFYEYTAEYLHTTVT